MPSARWSAQCSYTRDSTVLPSITTTTDKFGNLAPGHGVEHLEASEQVEYELRHAVVRRDRQVHHNLDNQEYVDTATEVVIHLLLFLCFFKSHSLGTYMVELLFL